MADILFWELSEFTWTTAIAVIYNSSWQWSNMIWTTVCPHTHSRNDSTYLFTFNKYGDKWESPWYPHFRQCRLWITFGLTVSCFTILQSLALRNNIIFLNHNRIYKWTCKYNHSISFISLLLSWCTLQCYKNVRPQRSQVTVANTNKQNKKMVSEGTCMCVVVSQG
jgi:hypothetical protein